MSKATRFKKISEDKLSQLKKAKIKTRTLSKMRWAVKAYSDWRHTRISEVTGFDVRIYESDLERVDLLEKDSFEYAMCKFLAEVTKIDGSDYPGKTLYHLIVSTQKHINTKGKSWKLIENPNFNQLRTV